MELQVVYFSIERWGTIGVVYTVDRSVKLYNEEKPHIGLQRKSPIMYEKDYLCSKEKYKAEQSTKE